MTTFYFPQNIFNNILEYCDDRIERKVKHHRQKLHRQLDKFDPDWVSRYIDYNEDFGNTTGERYQVNLEQPRPLGEQLDYILDYIGVKHENEGLPARFHLDLVNHFPREIFLVRQLRQLICLSYTRGTVTAIVRYHQLTAMALLSVPSYMVLDLP